MPRKGVEQYGGRKSKRICSFSIPEVLHTYETTAYGEAPRCRKSGHSALLSSRPKCDTAMPFHARPLRLAPRSHQKLDTSCARIDVPRPTHQGRPGVHALLRPRPERLVVAGSKLGEGVRRVGRCLQHLLGNHARTAQRTRTAQFIRRTSTKGKSIFIVNSGPHKSRAPKRRCS